MSVLFAETMSDVVSDIQTDAILPAHPLPPWTFNLEGTFLGFLGADPARVTAMVMEVEAEQLAIALPKKLRAAIQRRSLQPGDRIRCIGRSQLDFAAGVIQLNAYCLFASTSELERHLE